MNLRKILNDVVPVKLALPISWMAMGAGWYLGYTEGRRKVPSNEGLEELKEAVKDFQSLIVQNDFRMEALQQRVNHSIQQMARVISDLPNNTQRSFDDYASELQTTSSSDDRAIDVTVVGGEWDQATETAGRNPTEPYIIHRNEYFNDDMGFQSHATLTYYQGDDVLCDEHDTPIYNVHKIVGELKFGHGSNDPSIVYIRNEMLKAEYEVVLDSGMFQVEVLGEEVGDNLTDDFKHSRPLRRFRSD
jgi:hypothetical protein